MQGGHLDLYGTEHLGRRVTALVVLVAVLLAVVVCCAGAVVFRVSRPEAVASRLRHRVVVTLKSGAAFDGVLFEAGRSAWVLRNAHALGVAEDGGNVAVDGEVIVLTNDIQYAQRP